MRGFPPFHFLLFTLAFGLFAVPLARMTFARPLADSAGAGARESATGKETPSLVRMRFAHVPTAVSIKTGDTVIMQSAAGPVPATSEASLPLVIPPDGMEMLVVVSWPANTPDTAVTVEVEPDGLETRSQTHWSTGPAMSQIYSFTW